MQREKSVDILQGRLLPNIIKFAIPIALSSILQQLFNAADTTVVGQFAGSNALAAVGTNSELVALIVTISSGLAVGTNVLIAKYIGGSRKEKIPEAVFSSILFAIIVGILGLSVGTIFSRSILQMLHAPQAVFEEAVAYLRIYFLGYPFLVLYDFCAAAFRATGDSKRPFVILVLSGCINVALNLLFVIAFHKGVVGVAIATDIANLFSCVVMLIMLFRESNLFQLTKHRWTVSWECIKNILAIGVPSAIQGAVFCFANLFITASVNEFGEVATAGSTISINYEYFAYYVATAFGQTATTFTSQNFAAKNTQRCAEILKYCIVMSVLFTAVISVPATIFSRFAAMLFSHDSAVITAASFRIRIVLAIEPLCSLYEVMAGGLRGKGYSLQPAIVMILGICVVRVVWIFTVFQYSHTLQTLFIIFPLTWIITTVLMSVTYCLLNRKIKRL